MIVKKNLILHLKVSLIKLMFIKVFHRFFKKIKLEKHENDSVEQSWLQQ